MENTLEEDKEDEGDNVEDKEEDKEAPPVEKTP